MLAIELVSDRGTKERRPGHDRPGLRGPPAGGWCVQVRSRSSVLRMVPPMCLSMDDVPDVADGLDAAFTAARK